MSHKEEHHVEEEMENEVEEFDEEGVEVEAAFVDEEDLENAEQEIILDGTVRALPLPRLCALSRPTLHI